MVRFHFSGGQYMDVNTSMESALNTLERAAGASLVTYDEGVIGAAHVVMIEPLDGETKDKWLSTRRAGIR